MPPLKLLNAIVLGGSMLVATACGGSQQSSPDANNPASQPSQTQPEADEGDSSGPSGDAETTPQRR